MEGNQGLSGSVRDRLPTLTAAQERQVFRWVNGKTPLQHGFCSDLWTRQIVRILLAQRFDVHLSLASNRALRVRKAKQGKAEIYFWDESGFWTDVGHGTTWGAKGQTPLVLVPGQRQSISAASAVSATGAFWFAT